VQGRDRLRVAVYYTVGLLLGVGKLSQLRYTKLLKNAFAFQWFSPLARQQVCLMVGDGVHLMHVAVGLLPLGAVNNW
jgi:hypothetical protein